MTGLVAQVDVDTLTDWIGLPLAAVLVGLLLSVDVRRELGRLVGRGTFVGVAVTAVAFVVVVVVRISRLAA